MGLHTPNGLRKYLTGGERDGFLGEAERADRAVRTLCMTLAYAGCRLSEALALTADRVDLATGVLTFESLKKRRTGVYRSVPAPPALLDALDLVHGIRGLALEPDDGLARGARCDGRRPARGPARLAQGVAARVRGSGRLRRHPAQPRAEVARPRPAHDDGNLRERGWRRGEGHR